MNTAAQPVPAPKSTQKRMPRYLREHRQAFQWCMADLRRNPVSSIMGFLMMGLALTLPLFFVLLLQNARIIAAQWHTTPHITLYADAATPDAMASITQQVRATAGVRSVESITPEAGLQQLQTALGIQLNANVLGNNPLPATFVVTPTTRYRTAEALTALQNRLQKTPGIQTSQLDNLWVKRLDALLSLVQRISGLFIGFFAGSLVLIAVNTVRLGMADQRESLMLLSLMGASPAFIRRPLLYRGACYGAASAAVACWLMGLAMMWLRAPAQNLSASYPLLLHWHGLGMASAGTMLLACAALGWIGAYVASVRYLPNPGKG